MESLTATMDNLSFDELYKIFSYLSSSDLAKISLCCKGWQTIATVIMKTRIELQTLCIYPYSFKTYEPVYLKPSCCVLFHHSESTFTSKNLIMYRNQNNEESKLSVKDVILQYYYCNVCPFVILSCRHIYANFSVGAPFYGFILPTIEKVHISAFIVREADTSFTQLLETNIGLNYQIQCLLLFGVQEKQILVKNFIQNVQKFQNGVQFALGGGFVESIQMINPYNKLKNTDFVCLSFNVIKDKFLTFGRFDTYSAVITSDSTTQEDIEKCFKEVKDAFVPRKHGLIIIISCVARNNKIELNYIFENFPIYPTYEFEGNGEIGWNYYPSMRISQDFDNIVKTMSTVVVFMCWGKRRRTH